MSRLCTVDPFKDVLLSNDRLTGVDGTGTKRIRASHKQELYVTGAIRGSGRTVLIGFGPCQVLGSVEADGDTVFVNNGLLTLSLKAGAGDLLLIDTEAVVQAHTGGRILWKGIPPKILKKGTTAGHVKEDPSLRAADY